MEKSADIPPIVTVIVPIFNRKDDVPSIVENVRSQSLNNVELIVVDGGSMDGTIEALEKYNNKIDHWVSEKDGGIYSAFNKGVKMASGEWLIFLGSDDSFYSDRTLKMASDYLSTVTDNCLLVNGKVLVTDPLCGIEEVRGILVDKLKGMRPNRWSFDHQGFFHRKSFFDKYGLFDESFKICGDHDLLIRGCIAGVLCSFPDNLIISKFSIGGASSSPSNLGIMIREKNRSLKNNGLIGAVVVPASTKVKYVLYSLIGLVFGKSRADALAKYYLKLKCKRNARRVAS